ncbi:MAG: LOG family protein [Anaerolineae bacterium]|nr:LOG family protein [Anaerolineae bacterium]
MPNQPTIAVFGSSRPPRGSDAYNLALTLGRHLATAGYAVATGGYEGTMAAVSEGAAAAGGHVIGVGCSRIEGFRGASFNPFVVEPILYETLTERLLHLVRHNDGMVVLPGGIGTLSELALAWSLLQVGEIEHRPLVLLGDLWPQTLQAFLATGWLSDGDRSLLTFAATPEQVVAAIHAYHNQP